MLQKTSSKVVIAVDLDGTLILTDTLHEAAILLLREHPGKVVNLLFWLIEGKAALKEKLAKAVTLNPEYLPYNTELVEWLRKEKEQGREIVLCTASDQRTAQAIAEHLDLFDQVFASDGKVNLAGKNKRKLLEDHFGERGFDYVGNSKADLKVWEGCRKAILVNSSSSVAARASELAQIEKTFPRSAPALTVWCRVLRVHQYLKNLLLFVPLVAAHEALNSHLFSRVTLAFFSFSMCASAVYIINDLLDLENDRQHPRKRHRPFASGRISIATGLIIAPVCAAVSLSLAFVVGPIFTTWLLAYLALTFAYSLRLKRYGLADCLTLAALYTLRVVAGGAAAAIALSFWLLAFSTFIFLSLAFVKRYAELRTQAASVAARAHGRGYYVEDTSFVFTLGIVAGYASVQVLALYLHGETVERLYRTPEFIWGAIPLMLYWISWVWLKAHRGQMHDDPIVFAIKDATSWVVVLGMASFFAAAMVF